MSYTSGEVVYFVEAVGLDAVKIGWASDLGMRLKGLRTGCPAPLRVLRVIRGGHALELAMHERFKAHRTSGEWFRLSAIEAAIAALPDEMAAEKRATSDASAPRSKRWRRRYIATDRKT
jgi:hypothetical protein